MLCISYHITSNTGWRASGGIYLMLRRKLDLIWFWIQSHCGTRLTINCLLNGVPLNKVVCENLTPSSWLIQDRVNTDMCTKRQQPPLRSPKFIHTHVGKAANTAILWSELPKVCTKLETPDRQKELLKSPRFILNLAYCKKRNAQIHPPHSNLSNVVM